MSKASNPSENFNIKCKCNMKEIDETDEVVEDNETHIKDPQSKESKLRKHITGNEKSIFDSGDYYKR